LKDGQYRSIPVFVFFDDNFRELGHWSERPERMSELQARMRRDLFANDPLLSSFAPDTAIAQLPEEARLRLTQAYATFREENRLLSDREVVRELRIILERGLPSGTRPAQTAVGSKGYGAVSKHAARPVKVSITYCAACGYEPQTLDLTAALMRTFIYDLASIELIPWQDGAFDVVVDGDLVHSMYRDGGFPENETIIQAVRERLAR
jgi:selenoprotein W-related protein